MSLKANIVFLEVQALCTEGYALLSLSKVDMLMGWAILQGFVNLDWIKHEL